MIFARYLVNQYLKVLILVNLTFIALLLVSRLQEIAQFIALGAPPLYLLRFILYQLPYILPIALPVACLISAMILFQRLSHTHELTALRASGIALQRILFPLIVAGALLSYCNFYITSEVATTSHLATRKMAYDLTSVNPLLLLQKAQSARIKGGFIQMEPIRRGEMAENLVMALKNPAQNRLSLCLAKKVHVSGQDLCAEGVSVISTFPTDDTAQESHLLIENQDSLNSPAFDCAQLIRKKGWRVANDHLKFKFLRLRMQEIQKEIAQNTPSSDSKLHLSLNKCYSEIVRRIAMGLAPLSFTLIGIAFGIDIGRRHSKRGIIVVFFLAAFALSSFFMAKELDHLFFAAASLFLVPHITMLLTALWSLKQIYRGIE